MTWTLYNQAKTNEAWLFQRLLVDLVDSFSYPDLWAGIGRKPLPVRDMLIASALKAYHGYSNRLVVSDLKLRDILRCDVPHFNSVGNYLSRRGFASIVDRLVLESALPLAGIDSSWSTDSTGFGLPYMLDWVEVRALKASSGGATGSSTRYAATPRTRSQWRPSRTGGRETPRCSGSWRGS
jgi:hypothetical protein